MSPKHRNTVQHFTRRRMLAALAGGLASCLASREPPVKPLQVIPRTPDAERALASAGLTPDEGWSTAHVRGLIEALREHQLDGSRREVCP